MKNGWRGFTQGRLPAHAEIFLNAQIRAANIETRKK